MSNAPHVSVVIPAYRHASFIGEAIRSVLDQTFQDFEIIVIDDGSPDDTAAVAERALAGDPRTRLLRQGNAGSHATINRGIELARGTWVGILNSDDRFHPERLERLLKAAGSGADFLVSDLRLIDASGTVITDSAHWFNRMIEGFRQSVRANGCIDGLLYGNYTASTSNFFFRRELVSAIGGLRNYRYIVDWEFALRAALHAPQRFMYLIDEPLLDYRLHGANTILAGALNGALEINRMQRGLLHARYGVPPSFLASLHRNQRHQRRYWRELGEQRMEGFVRQREADLALLREALDLEVSARQEMEGFVRQREVDLALLREALDLEVSARAQLRVLQASRSWRLTAPLRRLAEMLRFRSGGG